MRTIISKIAASLVFAVGLLGSARADGTGMPMMRGITGPTELASMVDASLAKDPTGQKLLDPARCKHNGSCANAHDYLIGIQLAHPSAKLGNIAELPRYLRSLVPNAAPAGEWHMSRLLVRGNTHTYDAKGWHRAFFKGEQVWDDPNTGEHILADSCQNVVGEPLVPPVVDKVVPPAVVASAPPAMLAPAPLPKPAVLPPQLPVTCPEVYFLYIDTWVSDAMKVVKKDRYGNIVATVADTHAKEEKGQREFSKIKHVSKEFGAIFRQAHADGQLPYSAVEHTYRVSLIKTPESRGGDSSITEELPLYNVKVTGTLELSFPASQLIEWDAVRVVNVDGGVQSPPRFSGTGLHEMRLFNHLVTDPVDGPAVKGEWFYPERPKVRECRWHEHWIDQ